MQGSNMVLDILRSPQFTNFLLGGFGWAILFEVTRIFKVLERIDINTLP